MRKRLRTHEHGMNPMFFQSHTLKAFTRFELFPEMLLFAKVKSTPYFVQEALDFFCHRFPPFVIALYNAPENRLYVQSTRKDFFFQKNRWFETSQNALEWLRPMVRHTVAQRMEFSVEWKPEYYEKFFETQFIESRKNLKLQNRMMPLQALDKNSVEYRYSKMYRRTLSNITLKQFFFDKIPAQNPPIPIQAKNGFKPKNAE